jgi:hypothetical protein
MNDITGIIASASRSLVKLGENQIQLGEARSTIADMNIRLNAILVKAETANTDGDIFSVVVEFEIECKTEDGKIIKLKGSGVLKDAEVKAGVDDLMEKRMAVMHKLKELLKRIKDKQTLHDVANRLHKIAKNTKQVISELGLKGKEKLAEITLAFERTCQELGVNLTGKLSGSGIAANDEDRESPYGGNLPPELLSVLRGDDYTQKIWAIFDQEKKDEDRMNKEAEERHQKERLIEKRSSERLEKEKIAQARIRDAKQLVDLSLRSAENREATALNQQGKTDARVAKELLKLDARAAEGKPVNPA